MPIAGTRKSTGPRTPEGRAAVRRNALTHGLTASDILLDTEEDAPFEELLQAFTAEYDPQTPTEQTLVEQLVCAAWRLRRVRLLEKGIFNNRLCETAEHMQASYEDPSPSILLGHVFLEDASGPAALTTLSRFEGRIERSYYRALRELRLCRDLRDRHPGRAKSDLQKQTQFDPGAGVPAAAESPPLENNPLEFPPTGSISSSGEPVSRSGAASLGRRRSHIPIGRARFHSHHPDSPGTRHPHRVGLRLAARISANPSRSPRGVPHYLL